VARHAREKGWPWNWIREGKITGQETERGVEDIMDMKVIIPSAKDWDGISSKEFADR
jgi:hypothetical protein